jgi:hypothetical protein
MTTVNVDATIKAVKPAMMKIAILNLHVHVLVMKQIEKLITGSFQT